MTESHCHRIILLWLECKRIVLGRTLSTVESTMLPLEEPCPAIEVMLGTVSIKISNDVDPKLLSQILKAVTGTC